MHFMATKDKVQNWKGTLLSSPIKSVLLRFHMIKSKISKSVITKKNKNNSAEMLVFGDFKPPNFLY